MGVESLGLRALDPEFKLQGLKLAPEIAMEFLRGHAKIMFLVRAIRV